MDGKRNSFTVHYYLDKYDVDVEEINIMRKDFLRLIIFSLSLMIAVTLWGRGSFMHFMAVAIPAYWFGLPLFVVSSLLLIVSFFRKSPGMKKVAIKGLMLSMFLGIQLLSLVGGKWIYKKEVNEAKRYCEAMITRLKDFKRVHGRCPHNITELKISRHDLPRLLQEEHGFYRCTDEHFVFSFKDHGGIFGQHIYDTKSKRWVID